MRGDDHDMLVERVRALEREMQNVPLHGSRTDSRHAVLRIGQGNTIWTNAYLGLTIYGVKVPTSAAAAVPSATPSMSAGGTYADGLCAATLIGGPFVLGTVVWAATQVEVDGTDESDALIEFSEGAAAYSTRTVQVPITGGGGATAAVYLLGQPDT